MVYTRETVSSPVTEHPIDSLAKKYSRLIRSAVGRVAGPQSPSIAEDVEQNVLTALWRAMPDEQIPTHPSSYLYRSAVRETVRAMKGARRVPNVELDEGQHDPRPAPDHLLETKELGGVIRSALSTLSPDRRRAVRAHLMGFDVREIMAMQNWPYNKARNLIARGMADLRHALERRGVRG